MFVNGVAGETIEWKYGVPQGSVLSPLLFILFIDPMVSGLKCLWSSHDDIDTIAEDMNADLSLISSWGRKNDLKFGLKKCKVMWFQKKRDKQIFPEIRMEGDVLEQVHELKYLGLILDEGLTFK